MNSQLKSIPDGIFISYRRDDSGRWAQRLHYALQGIIGKQNIFIDNNFELGKDWKKQIDQALNKSTIVIILIGPDFLKIKDKNSKPRIESQDDIVRYEIRSALTLNKIIFPVLVDNSSPPLHHLLPADISPIASFNYNIIREINDLKSLCYRIKLKLHGNPQRQFHNISRKNLRSSDNKLNLSTSERNIVKKARTSAVQYLINAGWDIDTSKKGSLSYNARFKNYRFRFDVERDLIWLEKKRKYSMVKTPWKFAGSFPLIPEFRPHRSKNVEFTAFLSAISNPEAYLTRNERMQYNGVKKNQQIKSKKSQYDSIIMSELKKTKESNGIFICYQRDDVHLWADLLVSSLGKRIGKKNIFTDKFLKQERCRRELIDQVLKKSAIVIILIGPNFLKLKNESLEPRNEYEDDLVLYEIQSSISSNKIIFPVLVDDTKQPLSHILPAEVNLIANLHSRRINSKKDIESLCDFIEVQMHGNSPGELLKTFSDAFALNNQNLINKAKNIAIQNLIDSGWDINTQKKGAPSFNDRFQEYRFRFNDKKGLVLLEKVKRISERKPLWKIEKKFNLAHDIISSNNKIALSKDFISAVNNPGKYILSREINQKNSKFGENLSFGESSQDKNISSKGIKEFGSPTLYDLSRIFSDNSKQLSEKSKVSEKLTKIEELSRSAEKIRRDSELKNIISHFDIDCENEIVTGTKFSPLNDTLAISHRYEIKLWNIDTKKWKKNSFSCSYYINTFCWSESGLLVLGLENGDLVVWNPITDEKYKAPKINPFFMRSLTYSQLLSNTIESLDWSKDERFIVYTSEQFPAIIWDRRTNSLTKLDNPFPIDYDSKHFTKFERIKNKLEADITQWAGMGFNGSNVISFQTTGHIFAVGKKNTNDSKIVFIDTDKNETVCRVPFKERINDLKPSPNNKHVVIASDHARVHIVNIKNPEDRTVLIGHELVEDLSPGGTSVVGIAFRPNSDIFASIGEDKNLIIWDANKKIMKSCIQIALYNNYNPNENLWLSWYNTFRNYANLWLSWSQSGSLLSCPWEGSRVRIFETRFV